MSRVEQPKAARPIPRDEKLAGIEAERRLSLKENVAYQAGQKAALGTFLSNTWIEFNAKLAVVRKAAITRDVSTTRRQHYDRKHGELVAVAQRLHECTGAPVTYPAWLPPPEATEEVMVTTGVVPTTYKETRGMGPSGKGLPSAGIPGSATDWLAK